MQQVRGTSVLIEIIEKIQSIESSIVSNRLESNANLNEIQMLISQFHELEFKLREVASASANIANDSTSISNQVHILSESSIQSKSDFDSIFAKIFDNYIQHLETKTLENYELTSIN